MEDMDFLQEDPLSEPQPAQNVAAEKVERLMQNIGTVIKGKDGPVRLLLTTLLAGGHVLLEDNPGTGKTVMAKTLAGSISGIDGGADFKRIQFTPDLLPMDLIGTHIFDEGKKDFIFKKGPLFCNVLLADEINRASPKVQSALLECMAEHQITIGDTTYPLAKLFFTIATQNPVETEGTYPLPNAQLDRFFMKIHFGYVDADTELDIYNSYLNIANHLSAIQQVLTLEEVLQLQNAAAQVHIHEALVESVRNIVRATREHPAISLGASTRSGIIYLKCLKAFALLDGRDYVTEDDLSAIAEPVLHHRLIFRNKEGRDAVSSIVENELKRLSNLNLDK